MTDYHHPGAGFIIVKKLSTGWKVLGLKIGEKYDLPKGRVETKDKGNLFLTAQRECFEECGILISSKNLKWGNSSIQLGNLTLFIAETDIDPIIRINPQTGVYEHEAAEWLDWNALEKKVYGYLGPAIVWARNHIE